MTRAADTDYVELLQWALPHLGLRWPGFRKVRRQVIKRMARRITALQLHDANAYRRYLGDHDDEWTELDALCRITISRFYRDRRIFDALAGAGIPELVRLCRSRGEHRLRCWSAGCGAGEKAYTLVLIWNLLITGQAPDLSLTVTATDADPEQIERAVEGCYTAGSLKELPAPWRDAAFTDQQGRYCIRPQYREQIRWAVEDLRHTAPAGPFALILCRNLAFTYFSAPAQQRILQRFARCLMAGGLLVLGAHETLSDASEGWSLWRSGLPIYRKSE